MKRILATIGTSLLLAASGCATAPEIEPAPVANKVSGPGQGAMAEQQNIVVEAFADAWEWTPATLNQELTPLLVTIRNNSDRPVAVQYSKFQLVTADGRTLRALPPYEIGGTVVQNVGTLGYPNRGFSVYGGISPYYTDMTPFTGPYSTAFDTGYYDTYYRELVRIELPTRDMIQRAMPEGVLEPGGEVTGFLYMQNVGDQMQRLEFSYELTNANTGEQFGAIDIPFVAEG